MDITILKNMGLAGIDYSYVFIGLAAAVVILLILCLASLIQIAKLKSKYKKFMTGKDAKNLESDILQLFKDNKVISEIEDKNKKDIEILYNKLEGAYQRVGLVKYDAFEQMGGQLSFSLALLNERNDGFILNSVHSSEGCYTYTKEIKNGLCQIALGKEEEIALTQAIES